MLYLTQHLSKDYIYEILFILLFVMIRSRVVKIYALTISILLVVVTWQCYMNFTKLENTKEKIRTLKRYRYSLEKTLENLTAEREVMLIELAYVRSEVNNTEEQLEQLHDKISKLKSRNKYMLHDLSYAEVLNFIRRDKTNRNKYVENEYVCSHFARDVNNNAESQGIRCGFVIINLTGNANHAIIAFNTTDRGLVFFEPQTDERVRYLETGKDYWADCVIPAGNYYYERDPNNIIEGFIIIW